MLTGRERPLCSSTSHTDLLALASLLPDHSRCKSHGQAKVEECEDCSGTLESFQLAIVSPDSSVVFQEISSEARHLKAFPALCPLIHAVAFYHNNLVTNLWDPTLKPLIRPPQLYIHLFPIQPLRTQLHAKHFAHEKWECAFHDVPTLQSGSDCTGVPTREKDLTSNHDMFVYWSGLRRVQGTKNESLIFILVQLRDPGFRV